MTWHRTKTLQECREACGGMGFMAANRIGPLMNDSNIDVTWEGDNNVVCWRCVCEHATHWSKSMGV